MIKKGKTIVCFDDGDNSQFVVILGDGWLGVDAFEIF